MLDYVARAEVDAGGTVVQIGSPEEVFGCPATPEVACLVNRENTSSGLLGYWII